MNEEYFKKMYLVVIEPDNSFESLLSFVQTAPDKKIAETLYIETAKVKARNEEISKLERQLAKANERFEKLIQEKEGYRLRLEKQKEVVERYQQEAIETAKAQERFCIGRVVDAFEKAQIPRHAKAGCIGEFNFIIEDGVCCPQCWEEQSADCDMCNGESDESGLSDLTATVPWGLCKDIWLRMNKIYAEQLRKEQEQ